MISTHHSFDLLGRSGCLSKSNIHFCILYTIKQLITCPSTKFAKGYPIFKQTKGSGGQSSNSNYTYILYHGKKGSSDKLYLMEIIFFLQVICFLLNGNLHLSVFWIFERLKRRRSSVYQVGKQCH